MQWIGRGGEASGHGNETWGPRVQTLNKSLSGCRSVVTRKGFARHYTQGLASEFHSICA